MTEPGKTGLIYTLIWHDFESLKCYNILFVICIVSKMSSYMAKSDIHWSTRDIIYTHVHWSSLMYTYVHWCSLIFTDAHSHSLLYTHVHWCILMFTDVHSSSLMYTHVHWCSLMFSDVHSSSLMYTSKFQDFRKIIRWRIYYH